MTDRRYFDNYGLKCEGETLEMGILDEISCFKAKIGVCGDPFPDEFEDKSTEIQISGPGDPTLTQIRSYTIGTNKATIKVFKAMAKLTESGEITITSRSLFEYVVGPQCPTNPPENYILERIWVHRFRVVPKPPTPSLTVERYISANNIKFIASGCPTSNTEYGYEYQWNNTDCAAQPNNFFSRNHNPDGTNPGAGGQYYRVRCTALNGTCVSDPSDYETGISYMPPDLARVLPEHRSSIQLIESLTRSPLLLSYHSYSVETAICSIDDNSNCTVQNVFDIIKSSNQYIAAITQDMRGIGYNDNRYSYDDFSPVTNYGTVNLSGPAIRFFLETGLAPVAKLIPNPIMTYIDDQTRCVINYTLPGHILSPGRVIRRVIQKCNEIYVVTIGEGASNLQFPFDIAAAGINVFEGKRLFKNVDVRVKTEFQRKFP
ncbi:hypothetical protein GCM10027185_49070 [Spirosoma pulveris]